MVYSERSTGKIIFGLIVLVGLAFLVYLFFGNRLSGIFEGDSLKGQVLQGTTVLLYMPMDMDDEVSPEFDTGPSDLGGIALGDLSYQPAGSGECVIGGCLEFNGIDSAIELPDDPKLDLGDGEFTIAFWLKQAADFDVGNPRIISKAVEQVSGYEIIADSSNIQFVTYQDGAAQRTIASGVLTADKWHHVAVVRAGATVNIYVDGLSDFLTDSQAHIDPEANSNNLYIGQYLDGTSHFTGFLDDVQIYTDALSPSQVSALYFQNTVLSIIETLRNSPNNADVVERHNTAKQLLEILAKQL